MAEANYKLSVSVIGAKELADAINSVDGFAKQAIKDAINKTAFDLLRRAKYIAPHKKGALWGSLDVGGPKNVFKPAAVSGNNIEATAGTNLEYARAQELGTVGMTINVPNGRRTKNGRTKPYSFKGNIKPKLYFQRARDSISPIYTKNMETALNKINDHLATKGISET